MKNIFYTLIMVVSLTGMSLAMAGGKKQTLPAVAKPFKAPEFALKDENDITYRLSDFRGKVVLINFWATWCPPCRIEMPSIERLWQKVKGKGIVILAINVGESADTVFKFTGQLQLSFPIPMDTKGEVIKKYPAAGLPTTYIISPAGVVTHRAVGSREWDDPVLMKQLMAMRIPNRNGK